MGLTVTTPPIIEPVGPSEVRPRARVADSTDDTDLQRMIETARLWVENATWRQLLTATLTVTLDEFPPCGVIYLPRAPLASVTSISYLDNDGVSQSLASSVYDVITDREPGEIRLAYDQEWPVTRTIHQAVTLVYVAGWSDADSVPAPIKDAIVTLVSDQYEIGHYMEDTKKRVLATLSSYDVHDHRVLPCL